jgi:hypothetical protein
MAMSHPSAQLPKVVAYKIISGVMYADVSAQVTAHLRAGWNLHGGLCSDVDGCAQAMIQLAPEDESSASLDG